MNPRKKYFTSPEDAFAKGIAQRPQPLLQFIRHRLDALNLWSQFRGRAADQSRTASAVLLLLGIWRFNRGRPEVCLILNKRSPLVRQPGDICCPGGSLSLALDQRLARMLAFPGFPLARWTPNTDRKKRHAATYRNMSVFLATSLRESFEEMGILPFWVRFLGPLPAQHLVLFNRVIYPMVGWIGPKQTFRTNYEVAEVIRVPLRVLMDVRHYYCYEIHFAEDLKNAYQKDFQMYPCIVYDDENGKKHIWGATYRIIMRFLQSVWDFRPPSMERLPVIKRRLDAQYFRRTKESP